MAIRTTQDKVKEILGDDYQQGRSLKPFITSFSNIVDRALVKASANGETISTDTAELMERWGAAHAYCLSDRLYQSRSTLSASGSFSGKTGMGLDFTPYGQFVKSLDETGWIAAISEGNVAGIMWVGKTETEAVDWDDRN